MTDLIVRKLRFAFAEYPVPFVWNQDNPAFSSMSNAVSFLAIGFEKMIVSMIAEAKPVITDTAIAEEADAFVRQEGQHSMAHRGHARALLRAYPGLAHTLAECNAMFDAMTATTSLRYRLAYTAALEATFTPVFKLMLDHDDTLFAPGDDRVASLFLWHFVEEVEHRSSALMIYDHVVKDPWYRMRMAPSIFRHVMSVLKLACEGFNRHIPLEERRVDALSMFGTYRAKQAWRRRVPLGWPALHGPVLDAFEHLPKGEMATALAGIVRSQLPHHQPSQEKIPVLASHWFARYAEGYDVTKWYTAEQVSA